MRLGLHVNADRALDRAVDYCRRAQPSVMKWLEPRRDIVLACRAASPETKHIGRVVWNPQTAASYGAFRDRTLTKARELLGAIDYWEGYNEHITPSTPESDVREFARQEVGLATRLNDEGFGALIGGFSTGVLDGGRLEAFRRAFEYMQEVGPDACALHFHEYAGAYMGLFVETPDGLNQWDHAANRWNGWSLDRQIYYDPTLTGWLTLRYRKLIPLLEREGWDRVHFVITESGIDDTNPRPGPANSKGWRDYDGTEWSRGPMGDFADQMHWYLWQLSHDQRVIGAVDFGFGTIDPQWNSFDLAQRQDMFDRVLARQLELPVGYHSDPVPEPPPPPPPPPPPDPVPEPPPPPPPPGTLDSGLATHVRAGEGWGAVARRVYALEAAPWGVVKAHAELIAAASGKTLADSLSVGERLVVPGWAVTSSDGEAPLDSILPPSPPSAPLSLVERLRRLLEALRS